MKALSPSKINLTLEILGIKENQYHEISSIMQTLDLSDEMSFNLSSDIYLFFQFGFLFSINAEIPSLASLAIILSVIILLVNEYALLNGISNCL